MRPTAWVATLAIASLAPLSCAQSMPACASQCLTKSLEQFKCAATEFDGICADQTLMDNVSACSLTACTLFEGLEARNATATVCKEPVRDRSHVAPVATAVTASMALAFVILRIYEAGVRHEFQWVDFCAVLAMICSIPMDVGEFYSTHTFPLYTWVTQVSYIAAIILTKMTILCFFMHVFLSRVFRFVCIGTLVHCVLFIVTTTIAAVLACIPVQYAWSAWTGSGEGVCFENNAFWWAHSATNIATDLWILALPIPQLLKLQLGRRKKIYLILMFSVGIVITIVSIIRFSGLVTYSTSSNPTYNNVDVATYSVIEYNVSIMCCCMPPLLSFLRRVMPTVFGSTNRPGNYKAGSYNVAKSPFPSNGIQKSVTHTVSYMPKASDSDVDQYHQR
ncbi:hypothetical protein C8A03DRAFT_48087 [Achaetomium macrosporum]|uniref:CFEM domain-containing protein n=1 Tax=Achaetomium macrosporum TaxID=79813 RepID=A0AAN7H3G8_9PEZI|nr:hypothetical protein C8A03DRAFT_48087 [Achaetomium macrosporum]